jgi:hypothetical protein
MKTTELDEQARKIIVKALKRTNSRARVSYLYGIPPEVVARYLENMDNGTLNARWVIRREMARLQAEKNGKNFQPTDRDSYKGTR